MSAKTEILAAVRAAIAQSQPAAPDPQVVRDYRFHAGSPAGSEAVVAEFVEALEDYHAHVVQVTAEQVPEAIDDLLESAEATSVVVPSGLPQAWQEAAAGQISRGRGRKRSDPRDVHVDSREEPLDKEYLADVDAVVTAARAGVSLSGTIVLDGEPDQGRRAITLLPDRHVCVVRASQVQGTVPEAVAILGEHAERPQTWIAGPSATSDIELVRVDGVHGPRTLCVVIVTDD
ncbi:MAG: lactate utilization protein C [Actinomyces sp.]|nr:lactate utilization protein C [Actinomyces sp.]